VGSRDTPLLPTFPGGAQAILPQLLQPHPGPVHPSSQSSRPAKVPPSHPQPAATLSWGPSVGSLSSLGPCTRVQKGQPAPGPVSCAGARVPPVSPAVPRIWAGCPGLECVPASVVCLLESPSRCACVLQAGSRHGRRPQGLLQVPATPPVLRSRAPAADLLSFTCWDGDVLASLGHEEPRGPLAPLCDCFPVSYRRG